MKRQTTDWENLSVMHISDKGFLSRTYKHLQINKKKTTLPKKLAKS